MGIQLGLLEFGDRVTAVKERLREVGGRDAREISIKGVVEGLATIVEVEAELDSILEASSDANEEVSLSIRSGRELLVRRIDFKREVHRVVPAGAFELLLEARDPVERSETEVVLTHTYPDTGNDYELGTLGNASAPIYASLTPVSNVTQPALSDGERTLTYDGVLLAGTTLVLDGVSGRVTLDGEDVTPYTDGELPRLETGDNTLTYTHDAGDSSAVDLILRYRDRWW